MPPQQHNQPTPPSGGPRPSFTPHAPQYGYGHEVPSQPQPQYQQHPSGQYEVVPPPTPGVQGPGNGGHNPYEFIVNPQKAKHSTSLFGGSNGLMMKVAVIAGGAVLLMIIAVVIISALGPKGSTTALITIAQRQQEIIRISTDAGTKATGQDIQNFANTAEITIASSQQQTLAYLTSHGVKKPAPKVLALDADSTTDTTLTNAQSAGTYDSAVVQNLTGQLQAYEGLLQSSFKQTSSESAKQLLQSNFATADKLLKQAKSIGSADLGN